MMAWPEDQQADWAAEPMLETAFDPQGNTSEHAQHGGNLFASLASASPAPGSGMTYSASCPSFSGMYDDELLRDLQSGAPGGDTVMAPAQSGLQPFELPSGQPFSDGQQEPLMDVMPPSDAMGGAAGYDYLMQFQQEFQDASQRQFPHQQALQGGVDDMRQQVLFLNQQQQQQQARRGFHGSQSFTSLSSMESEYQRLHASKRKKGGERWLKLQRHKSFDSTTPGVAAAMSSSAPTASSEYPTSGSTFSSASATPESHFLSEPPDSDMIGFSIDDFSASATPSAASDAASWPMDVYGSAPPAETGAAFLQQQGGKPQAAASASEAVSELDLLLSENERAHLFDAIRDFESPGGAGASASSSSAPAPACAPAVATSNQPQDKPQPRKKATSSPPLHPGRHRRAGAPTRSFSLSSSPPSDASMPPAGPSSVPMRTRLQQILVRSVQNADAGASLSSLERNYLVASPLFQAAKAPETAGSLWLLLHAAQCESGCEISGCGVMRRVLAHCLACDLLVGKCKQPCNDAKAMLLHYGSCNSKGSMHGRSCAMCWNLLEIDHSHQALSSNNNNNNGNGNSYGHATATRNSSSRSPSPRANTPPHLMPMPRSPAMSGSPGFRSPTLRPAGGGGKHVAIQPNPLPTASNPMGLLGALPPHFGYSLSLYLEQTSAPFRAEVKTRVEKRVTAAAGQDLLQHMQKKTRLRSLDDLRSEARTLVLGEMERELHFHMQAYSWAQAGDASAATDGAVLPPYLMSVAAAGFGAFQAAAKPASSPPTAPRRARSASAAASIAKPAPAGSPHKAPAHEK